MKILQVITKSDPFGGAQMVLYNIVKYLKQRNHDVTVLMGERGVLTNMLEEIGVDIIIEPSLQRNINLFKDYRAYRAIKEFVLEYKPDLIASHSSKAGYLSRLVGFSTKTRNVFTAHGWSFTEGISLYKRIVFGFIEFIIGRISDKIITVSFYDKFIAEKFKICNSSSLVPIHNGIEDIYKPSIKNLTGKIDLIMVARFSNQKDHTTLLKALSELDNKDKFHLHLIGNGPLESKMKDLAIDLNVRDNVTFYGFRSNVEELLNKCDIFILTTNYEGLPMSICEAMSCKLPVIASDVGGVSEMIDDSINGWLIPRGDYKKLCLLLNTIGGDPSLISKVGENARIKYLDNFTVEKMIDRTLELYSNIVHENL